MHHFFSQIRALFKRHGNPIHLLRTILSVFKHEGFAGVKWRISRLWIRGEAGGSGATHHWIRLFSQPSDEDYAALAHKIAGWPKKPMISVIMPVYNTPEVWLVAAIESVINQVYPNWELCIADDASPDAHVKQVLERYEAQDSRIKLCFRERNGHIAASSNTALGLVRGEYVALFDHDDLLERHALYRLAECIVADMPDMIYSDEALIEAKSGEVIGHAFRPAFSLELLRSHSYIVHLVAFKTALLKSIGGFDESLTISQDYDLILRAVEQAHVIVHIPEVLYRWRQHTGSTGHQQQDIVMQTSMNVLRRHLARCGEVADVYEGRKYNFFEVRYALTPHRIAIVIPTKNHGDLVRQCLESLARTIGVGVNYDVVVIDHASDDPASLKYFDEIRSQHKVLRYEGVFNFAAINNWAIAQLGEGYSHYLLCNNDIEAIEPGWLERMLELGQKSDIGIVGAKLYYPDARTIQHAGVGLGMFRMAEHYGKFMDKDLPDGRGEHPGYLGSLIANREMSAVTAACLLIRRDTYEWVHGFDEAIAVGFGDVDLCLRVRQAGYRVVFCPHAELIHHESYSRGKNEAVADPHPEDSAYFLNRWQHFIDAGDPYYNPNLTLYNGFWDLKGPYELSQEVGRSDVRRAYRKRGVAGAIFA